MNEINHALEACDLFISIGTSGNVYPASGFYQTAKVRKEHTVELNLEETGSSFDERIYGLASELVPSYFTDLLTHSETDA
jgi:NAD-dependent deacetylase